MDKEIQHFIAELQKTEQQADAASAAGDFPGLGTAAHRLRNQAGIVSGTALAEAASELEAVARRCDQAACSEWLRHIHDEIEVVTESMTRRRSAAHSV